MRSITRSVLLATIPALLCSAQVHAQAAPPALPDADPAIWVVKDPDTTIYLFGTFHALDGKADWFNDEVKSAFDQSGEIILEIPPAEDQSAMQKVIAKYALDTSGKPLSAKLSPASRDKLTKFLAGMGAPPTSFDKFKPFFAAVMLVMTSTQKLGLTGEKGAEAVLTKAAKEGKKPISGLETIDYQMSLFDKLPEAEQIEMLEETLDELDQVEAMFKRMNDAWTRGDADGFATLMNEMNADSPAAYKLLISDRNTNWAEWIDERLDKPGTVFVGVGAGHLGGKDSVQDMLEKRRIKADRVKQ
ncbi:MAG: TraB/GumN family protein [Pseudomonadota bacterium]|nr:TraB/GumN family protein [Pseudomonadota bacterium]